MRFAVEVDKAQAIFHPGDYVSGHVTLDLAEELKIRDIKLRFSGRASVGWQERQNNGNGSSYTANFNSEETYFTEEQIVCGKDQDKILIPAGYHAFPFRFVLPSDVPSSYQSATGRVVYLLKAHMDRPWAFDNYADTTITVVRQLDLNQIPKTMEIPEESRSATLCCLCCTSGPIEATLRLSRRGFVPGETILFQAYIENRSSRKMNGSKAKLTMRCSYITKLKTKVCETVLSRLYQPEIPPGESFEWTNGAFTVPLVTPSYLEKCSIINVQYFLQLTVDVAGPAVDLQVPIEIIIGSVPLHKRPVGSKVDSPYPWDSPASATTTNKGVRSPYFDSPSGRSTPRKKTNSPVLLRRKHVRVSPINPSPVNQNR